MTSGQRSLGGRAQSILPSKSKVGTLTLAAMYLVWRLAGLKVPDMSRLSNVPMSSLVCKKSVCPAPPCRAKTKAIELQTWTRPDMDLTPDASRGQV